MGSSPPSSTAPPPTAPTPGPDVAAHLAACDRCRRPAGRPRRHPGGPGAAPIEPLDELTRRRLVAGALRAADEPAAPPSPAGPAGATPPGLRRVGGGRAPGGAGRCPLRRRPRPWRPGGEDPPAAAPNAEESASPFLGDLGDLTDYDRLRLRLTGGKADANAGYAPVEPGPSPAAGAVPFARLPVPGASPDSGGLAGSSGAARSASPTTTLGPRSSGAGSEAKSAVGAPPPGVTNADTFATDQSADRDRVDTDTCAAALLDGPARGGRLTGTGTGTWRGLDAGGRSSDWSDRGKPQSRRFPRPRPRSAPAKGVPVRRPSGMAH